MTLAAALALALGSAFALNWGWVAQHTAAAAAPPLQVSRPLASLRILFTNLAWVSGFGVGILGWAFYVGALALAPLSLVQATSAGGIGVLALLARRATGEPLPGRQWLAVAVASVGLLLLGISLGGGSVAGSHAGWTGIAAWLGLSAVVAAAVAGPAAFLLAGGAGLGVAAGLLYAAGDVATKGAVAGGLWLLLVPAVLAAHGLAFVCLQLGFQRGGALATAGVSALLMNALPIVAGVVLFRERLPGGLLGGVRVAAFACVVVGAALLARREDRQDRSPVRVPPRQEP